jgi:hypothetical protein
MLKNILLIDDDPDDIDFFKEAMAEVSNKTRVNNETNCEGRFSSNRQVEPSDVGEWM